MLYYPRPLAQLLEQLEKLPGIGPKSAVKLSEAGLQVNGQGKAGAVKPATKVAEKK